MSFLKITDPSKRDFIVEEFLKSKKNIKQNFLSERLGDIGLQRELTKMNKPIVDSQSTILKEQRALLSTISRTSTTQARAFSVVGPSVWNGLPLSQTLLSRILSDTFYSSLKTLLFSRARVGSASE